MDIQGTLELYCDNEMRKLKQICNPMITKIGGISDKDYDDFYSIALGVLSDTVLKFEPEKEVEFQCYLASNNKRKFKTEVRDRNRKKRIPTKKISSINALVTEDGCELSEKIQSKFDTFEEACGDNFDGTKIEKYLKRLSIDQRKIVKLLSDGYKAKEIRKLLHMSNKEYSENLSAIQAYENVKILM